MKYKLISAGTLGAEEHEEGRDPIEDGLNALAAEGWRVVAILGGHVFVLERETAPGECDVCGCAITTYGGGTRCISCAPQS